MSGGRSCSKTARRRLWPRAGNLVGRAGAAPPAWPPAPGDAAAHDGTSSMSSGYSSLEEDAEDFFFTARTSFFRRAPQGKPRAGQQVSGSALQPRPHRSRVSRDARLHVSRWGAPGMLTGKEEKAPAKGILPSFEKISESCRARGRAGGSPARGEAEEGGGAEGPLLPSAPDGLPPPRLAQPAAGDRSEAVKASLPLPALPPPGTPFAPCEPAVGSSRALQVLPAACGPRVAWSRVADRRGRSDCTPPPHLPRPGPSGRGPRR